MAKRSWTKETAMAALMDKRSLKWCSAFDYLVNHCGMNPITLLKGCNGFPSSYYKALD